MSELQKSTLINKLIFTEKITSKTSATEKSKLLQIVFISRLKSCFINLKIKTIMFNNSVLPMNKESSAASQSSSKSGKNIEARTLLYNCFFLFFLTNHCNYLRLFQ